MDSNDDSETVGNDRLPLTDATAEDKIGRRSVLKLAGGAIAASALGFGTGTAAAIDVSTADGYEVWTVDGQAVYDLSDGETLANVLVDQTASGACLTIRARNRTDWTVRNVGFLGVGRAGDGSNRFQLQVSAPSGGQGLVENVWANGKARNGQAATELGGVYVRSAHAGHLDVRHTYIEGFGNNAVYASAVGKDGGNDGSVQLENCYHRDNTVSQFRIGSADSLVRHCVGVVDDPAGERGPYPGTEDNRNARGIWAKHVPGLRVEHSSFYVAPDDVQPDGAFEARYIHGRSHGGSAALAAVDCDLNSDAPTVASSTSDAAVSFTRRGAAPTVAVLQEGGVPLSPVMAARGERAMPPALPGQANPDANEEGAETTDSSTTDGSGSTDDGPTDDGSTDIATGDADGETDSETMWDNGGTQIDGLTF